MDGTHISYMVRPSEQHKFIGRKGHSTQNVRIVCDWNMCYIFALLGWEDIAHDACCLRMSSQFPS